MIDKLISGLYSWVLETLDNKFEKVAALNFTLQKLDDASQARAGVIETAHGQIPTPIFMPVGTAGSVKAVSQQDLLGDIDAKIILGNSGCR